LLLCVEVEPRSVSCNYRYVPYVELGATHARPREVSSILPLPFYGPSERPLKIGGYSTPLVPSPRAPASKESRSNERHPTSVVRKIFDTIDRCQNSKYGSLQTAARRPVIAWYKKTRYDRSNVTQRALHSQRKLSERGGLTRID
jgi:hypothetical protein